MTDDPGQPNISDTHAEPASRTAPDAEPEQILSLSTQQAGLQLNVDSRTIRRYIADGIKTQTGVLRLDARQVRTSRGMEWQIYQNDLEAFKKERDQQSTEGQTSEHLTTRAEVAMQENQALSTSMQIFANELERRSLALTEAHQTIERLSYEAGRQAGRNEELTRELEAMRQRVAELEAQVMEAQKLPKTPVPRRMRLLPWQKPEQ